MLADHQLVDTGPLLQRRGELLHDDGAAADDVDAALVHRPQRGALLTGHHQQFRTHRQQLVEPHPGQMNGVGVIRGHLQRQRGQRRHRAGHPHPGAGLLHRHDPQRLLERPTHHGPCRLDLVGGGRIGMQAPLGQPHTPDVGRIAGGHLERIRSAQYDFGRAAAEVHHHERPGGTVEFTDSATEGQLGLLGTGDHLGHRAGHHPPQHLCRHREERIPVGHIAGR